MLLQAVNFTGYHLIRRTLLCGINQHCMACLESGLLSLRKFKLLGIIIGSLSKDDGDGDENEEKCNRFRLQNNNFARVMLCCTFLCCLCTTTVQCETSLFHVL